MSDFNSSLPIRTENAGDVIVKLADATTPGQQVAVDVSGNLSVKVQNAPSVKLEDGAGNNLTSQVNGAARALDVGINVAGAQIDPRSIRALTSSDIVTANQGTKGSLGNAWPVLPTDGTNSQSYLATGEAKVSVTQPLPAGTNTIGSIASIVSALPAGSNTIGAVTQASGPWTQNLTQVAGSAISLGQKTSANSFPVVLASDQSAIPVTISDVALGTPVNDFKDASAIAAGATDNHDYTVTAGKTLHLHQIATSGSGKLKAEVQIETGVATGVFNSKFVQFNSTSSPNANLALQDPISVAAGVRVRVIMSNLDKAAQDLYSTISGQEV